MRLFDTRIRQSINTNTDFWFKFDLDVLRTPSSTQPRFELMTRGPPDHKIAFHVPETPILTTWPSEIFLKKMYCSISLDA